MRPTYPACGRSAQRRPRRCANPPPGVIEIHRAGRHGVKTCSSKPQEDHPMHAFRKMLVATVAVAALAPSTALAHDSYHSGAGVPRGQIEASQYTVEITGSNAVA